MKWFTTQDNTVSINLRHLKNIIWEYDSRQSRCEAKPCGAKITAINGLDILKLNLEKEDAILLWIMIHE